MCKPGNLAKPFLGVVPRLIMGKPKPLGGIVGGPASGTGMLGSLFARIKNGG